MKQQTKTKLFALILLLVAGAPTNVACTKAAARQTISSEVAEQKSVIDEQAIPLIEPLIIVDEMNTIDKELEETEVTILAIENETIYSEGWVNSSVNIRAEPNIESEILDTIDYNTLVLYKKSDSGWIEIKYKDNIAYIKAEYISDEINPPLSPYVDLINNLTDYEKYLIYQITFAEAGNQNMEGQRAVIEVIFNRVLSDKFPDTIEGVLGQKGQFATWKKRDSVKHNSQQEEALQLVYTEAPLLESNYLIFSTKKQSYGKNYIKIDDQWFGVFK